jgi:hypothetical protein
MLTSGKPSRSQSSPPNFERRASPEDDARLSYEEMEVSLSENPQFEGAAGSAILKMSAIVEQLRSINLDEAFAEPLLKACESADKSFFTKQILKPLMEWLHSVQSVSANAAQYVDWTQIQNFPQPSSDGKQQFNSPLRSRSPSASNMDIEEICSSPKPSSRSSSVLGACGESDQPNRSKTKSAEKVPEPTCRGRPLTRPIDKSTTAAQNKSKIAVPTSKPTS